MSAMHEFCACGLIDPLNSKDDINKFSIEYQEGANEYQKTLADKVLHCMAKSRVYMDYT